MSYHEGLGASFHAAYEGYGLRSSSCPSKFNNSPCWDMKDVLGEAGSTRGFDPLVDEQLREVKLRLAGVASFRRGPENGFAQVLHQSPRTALGNVL